MTLGKSETIKKHMKKYTDIIAQWLEHPTSVLEVNGFDSCFGAQEILFLSISTWEHFSVIYTLSNPQICLSVRHYKCLVVLKYK